MYANLCLLLSALSLTLPALAVPTQPPTDFTNWRLIQTGPNLKPKWLSLDDIDQLHHKGTKFVDVTFTRHLDKLAGDVKQRHAVLTTPTGPTQQSVVSSIVAGANTDLMKAVLTPLTKFNTRYYTTTTGKQSSEFLLAQIQALVKKSNTKGLNVTVTPFKHSWVQSSIICRIEGQNGNAETVIVGAHQDSINQSNPRSGRAPGADDDGSGAVTLIEGLRLLLEAGYQPLRPVEFHWYSGEEAGLLGSQAIAQQYQTDNRLVAGMMQLDMTSFPNPDKPDVGIVTDYVDDGLTSLLRSLVTTYTALTSGDFECGYACSDHASWNQAGYASSIPFESSNMEENFKNMHTPNDDINTVDFNHALNFVKLVVAFVVEMAHP